MMALAAAQAGTIITAWYDAGKEGSKNTAPTFAER